MPNNFLGIYEAVVYDLNDPLSQGMARLLIPAVLGRAMSAWARPVLGASGVTGIKVGDAAWVVFEGGDMNRPVWFAVNAAPKVAAANIVGDTERVGVIKMWPTPTAPPQYLTLDGSEQPVATYPVLDSILGTTYGSRTNGSGGVGSTHFRLPDFRSRSPMGIGNLDIDGWFAMSAGLKWGDHRMQQHNHGGQVSLGVTDFMRHINTGGLSPYSNHVIGIGGGSWYDANGPTYDFVGGSHYHYINNDGQGSMQNVHPVLGVNFIIRAG
jgi:microcystin-dependent protein